MKKIIFENKQSEIHVNEVRNSDNLIIFQNKVIIGFAMVTDNRWEVAIKNKCNAKYYDSITDMKKDMIACEFYVID